MARGFVTGVLWGCIVMGTGLVALSQFAPVQVPVNTGVPKGADVVAPKPAEAATAKDAVTATVLPEVAKPPPGDARPGVAVPAAAGPPKPATTPRVEAAVPVVVTPVPKVVAKPAEAARGPVTSATVAAPVVPAERTADPAAAPVAGNANPADTAVKSANGAPAIPPVAQPETPPQDVGNGLGAAPLPGPLPDLPAAPEAPPTLAGLEFALTAPGAEVAPKASEPVPPQPDGAKDALLALALVPEQVELARLPQIAPADDPSVVAVAPQPVPLPKAEVPPKESPATTIESQVPTLPPVKSLTDKVQKGLAQVPGVEVGVLPHIGAAPKVEAPVQDARPVVRFARKFAGAAGKPLFVILLRDVGAAGMSREALAKLPFPVSFVVDPLASDAGEASKAYRAAGQEVVTLATGIPAGAVASDLAETFQTLARILPESVAVIDQDLGGFQDDRPLAGLVLPILQDEGRGLVTYDRGLNAADQIARRDGVPAAVIFRRLDGAGENKATIRRYLDRAAFKAAQDGAVVVIGDTLPATVAAILEWTVEGRASSVTLAPLTAVLGR